MMISLGAPHLSQYPSLDARDVALTPPLAAAKGGDGLVLVRFGRPSRLDLHLKYGHTITCLSACI